MSDSTKPKPSVLRAIPSVDQLIHAPDAVAVGSSVGQRRLTAMAREVISNMRAEIRSQGLNGATKEALLSEAIQRLHRLSETEARSSIRHVINATGVILHTNLGRAPLSEAARQAVSSQASSYCTLEYDPATGSRGSRGSHAEELLKQLTGAEGALVVNNCASAALLVLTVLARNGESIISRGELVEIGGDFRVPDVMANSGTRMVEVGSTNRTRLDDYRRAINSNTRVIMRVHPSNYRIIGFTSTPELSELASLAHEAGLVLYEDAGSGVLQDLSQYGLTGEPIVSESIAAGVDVVSFSGDKLLGGPQAGLIVGRRAIVDRLRSHSLYRALRADKLCLAALEATLDAHRRKAFEEIPALKMLALTAAAVEERASRLVDELSRVNPSDLMVEVIPGESAIGGGSAPGTHPQTALIALRHKQLSADELERKLRHAPTPVISRITEGQVTLDLRTVSETEEVALLDVLVGLTRHF